MRGKAWILSRQKLLFRITPAYAGKRAFSGRIRKAV